jgi:ABC-type enterochelin transport system substrate-binding protein
VIIDFELFESFSSSEFIENLQNSLTKFMDYLAQTNNDTVSKNTTVSDVKSYAFATIQTLDPSIIIKLSLEVGSWFIVF